MTMQDPSRSAISRRPPAATLMLRCALAALLGVAAALIISCGSSGAGLIPTGNAGPLQSDFETVAQAVPPGPLTLIAMRSTSQSGQSIRFDEMLQHRVRCPRENIQRIEGSRGNADRSEIFR